MNISEEKLKEIIRRIILEITGRSNLSENNIEKSKVYIVLNKECDARYINLLEQMTECGLFNIYIVADEILKNDAYKTVINKYVPDENIRYFSEGIAKDLSEVASIFPVVERDLVVKTALCISDNFCNQWITSAIEQGGKTVFLKSGLRPFTNKEPKAYINKIVSYYRTVLEYGIEIQSSDALINYYKRKIKNSVPKKELNYPQEEKYYLEENNQEIKKIITLENLEQHISNDVIVVNPNDVITDLAREKARTLNVEIKEL